MIIFLVEAGHGSDAGLLSRFHGGLRLPGSTTQNIAYRQRQAMVSEATNRIARAIANACRTAAH